MLEQGFDYPEQSIYLNQVIVVEASGELSVYRMWFQDYTRKALTQELEAEGFAIQGIWSDLLGTSFTEDAEWIGVVAQTANTKRGYH